MHHNDLLSIPKFSFFEVIHYILPHNFYEKLWDDNNTQNYNMYYASTFF